MALLNDWYLHGYLHFFLFVDEKISPALTSVYTVAVEAPDLSYSPLLVVFSP